VGERAEDVFYVTDAAGGPLNEQAKQKLARSITETLDRRV
jgi:UTP:GlnB (protein PII) uridylyltransferase